MHLICAKSIKWGNWNSINRFTYKNHFSLHTLFCIKYRFNRWELGEWCVTYCNNRIYVKLVSFIVKFKIKKLKLNQKRKKKYPVLLWHNVKAWQSVKFPLYIHKQHSLNFVWNLTCEVLFTCFFLSIHGSFHLSF